LPTKYCSRCREEKPIEAFHRNNSARDGLATKCRLCTKTYGRQLTQGYAAQERANPPHEKRCNICERVQPIAAFAKNRTTSDGFARGCKVCRRALPTNLSLRARLNLKIRIMTKHAKRRGHAPARITIDELAELLANHSGICDMPGCERPAKVIDHCHQTGIVRGRLCHGHNWGLGHFHDNPDELRGAIEYLSR
jgi:Recombination endonuclease VII